MGILNGPIDFFVVSDLVIISISCGVAGAKNRVGISVL